MTTPQPTDNRTARGIEQYGLPFLCFAIGIGYLVAGWIGDNLRFGLFGLGLMSALGVAILVTRKRSETVQGLMDRRDERINSLDLKATAFAGSMVILAVIAAFMVEVARGNDTAPYSWLGALGGLSYLVALVVLRLRT